MYIGFTTVFAGSTSILQDAATRIDHIPAARAVHSTRPYILPELKSGAKYYIRLKKSPYCGNKRKRTGNCITRPVVF